jgi:hypothetical protein
VARELGVVDVFAARAEELDGVHARDVGLANGQDGLALAVDSWAAAKLHGVVLVHHRRQSAVGEDVPRVNEAVQHLRCRFYAVLLLLGEGLI